MSTSTTSRRTVAVAVTATLVAAALAAAIGYRFGQHHPAGGAQGGGDPTASIAAGEAATRRHIEAGIKAGQVDPVNNRPILYYHDPMVPGKRFDAPAKSPFMDMMLVPVYGGGAGAATETAGGGVSVDPRIQQNLGVRTAEVTEAAFATQLQAVGNIAWNERDQSVVTARATGFIEKLHVRATLDRVRAGQPFADLYVPEWVAAQEEFLAVRRMAAADAPLVAAARQRMLLAGMNETQVQRVASTGTVQARVTVTAPSSGVVAELTAREGMTVTAGTPLARINGLSTVWALAELPESQAGTVRAGQAVTARTAGAPGTVYRGTVQALLPQVNPGTRTLTARVQLANPRGELVPGLFVTLDFVDPKAAATLQVPSEAVIQTGRRAVVMLADADGRFTPVDVETGRESGGRTEVRKGLKAGQRVVVSSQFLIDSEASLKGVESRLGAIAAPVAASAPAASQRHAAEGRIEALGPDSVTLDHGPIRSMGMGAMTMEFALPASAAVPTGLKTGERVGFEFVVDPNDGPQITRITRLAPSASPGPGSGAAR